MNPLGKLASALFGQRKIARMETFTFHLKLQKISVSSQTSSFRITQAKPQTSFHRLETNREKTPTVMRMRRRQGVQLSLKRGFLGADVK